MCRRAPAESHRVHGRSGWAAACLQFKWQRAVGEEVPCVERASGSDIRLLLRALARAPLLALLGEASAWAPPFRGRTPRVRCMRLRLLPLLAIPLELVRFPFCVLVLWSGSARILRGRRFRCCPHVSFPHIATFPLSVDPFVVPRVLRFLLGLLGFPVFCRRLISPSFGLPPSSR